MSNERRITKDAPKDPEQKAVDAYKASLLSYRDAEKALQEAQQKLPEVAALQAAHKALQEAITTLNATIVGAA